MATQNDRWYPNLVGRVDTETDRAIRTIFKNYYDLNDRLRAYEQKGIVSTADLQAATSLSSLQKKLQSDGQGGLNVTNLIGRLMTNQFSYVPKFPVQPTMADPTANVGEGTLITVGRKNVNNAGLLKRFNQAFDDYNPIQALGTELVGTHADRLATNPNDYEEGTTFFETDRTVLYVVLVLAGVYTWVYEVGTYNDVIANRPSDLGTHDAGFLFYATNQSLLYRWTGSTWVINGTIGVTLADTHANRSSYSPSAYPIGTLYFETDRRILYRNNGSAWLYVAGVMEGNVISRPSDLTTTDAGFQYYMYDTGIIYWWNGTSWLVVSTLGRIFFDPHANRSVTNPSSYPPGLLYFETDRHILYYSDGTNWIYAAGIMEGNILGRPSDLTTTDAGFVYYMDDVGILYWWNGSSWLVMSTLGRIFFDPHANRSVTNPADYPPGLIFFETDRWAAYYSDGTNWVLMNAFYADVAANRPADLTTTDAMFQFYATDTGTFQFWTGSSWTTIGGGGGGGAWTNYTPTLTNLSSASVNNGYYEQVGKTVNFRIYIQATASGGSAAASLPVAEVSGTNNRITCACQFLDLGTGALFAGTVNSSSGTLVFNKYDGTAPINAHVYVIILTGSYEAA